MHVGAAELLGAHDLARRGPHQRRSAQKDRAGVFDDHRFVGHRRHVRAPGGARTHDRRDLRDALGRHRRLIVKDPAEMVAVGKHLVLKRQKRSAGVDQIDAREPVLPGDLLCAQMFLDR